MAPEDGFVLTARWKAVIGVGAALLLLVGFGALWLVRQIDPPGRPGEPVAVEIPEGTPAARIAALLDDQGVITSRRVFRLYTRITGAGEFQAGIYRKGEFRKRMAMGDVVDALEAGPEIEYSKLTIPEGFTLAQIADRVGTLPGASRDRFLETASSGTVRSKYQPEGSINLEGLLFPDTYFVAEDESEEQVLARMVTLFEQVADEVGLGEKAVTVGLSPYQVVTLASLVEEETKVDDERPVVASVIYNRLARGMNLEVDASIDYAYGRHIERKLFEHLEVESPYNTYKHAGLTPTPIASPGRPSLEAVLSPETSNYLFYVKIDPDGRHGFAETFEQHQRNIAEAERRGVR